MKSTTLVGLGIVATIVLGSVGMIYTSYSRGQDVQNSGIAKNTETISQVELDVNTIQTDIGYIKDDISESKDVQKEILDKLDKLKRWSDR